jgi:hypothetical protein
LMPSGMRGETSLLLERMVRLVSGPLRKSPRLVWEISGKHIGCCAFTCFYICIHNVSATSNCIDKPWTTHVAPYLSTRTDGTVIKAIELTSYGTPQEIVQAGEEW